MTETKDKTPARKPYSEKLKDPRWQKKRLEILSRDNFTCTLCRDTKTTLHVHHEKYKGEPWDVANEHLKTLCEDCHKIIEGLKEDWMGEYVTAIIKYKPTLSRGPMLMCYFLVLEDDYVYYRLSEPDLTYVESNYLDSWAITELLKSRGLHG